MATKKPEPVKGTVKKLKLKKENLKSIATEDLDRVTGGMMDHSECCKYGGTAIDSASDSRMAE